MPVFAVLWQILLIIGSLGVFIFGMKMMSDGVQKLAGKRLRNILRSVTNNPLKGIFTGFVTTSLVQSSSATTVMVVSFVNAGLLTLTESFGLIMGANIGTTLTSWMVNYAGLKVSIAPFAIVLVGIGMPLMFSSRSSVKNFSEFVIGFGILFIGLDFLKTHVPNLDDPANVGILEFLNRYANLGFLSTLLFIGIGMVLTVVVQSSSASTAITLVMVANGWIGFPLGAAMILGENIGTTITANIAALVANNNAKRAALFHLLFNILGVCWMLLAMHTVLNLIERIPFEKVEAILVEDIGVTRYTIGDGELDASQQREFIQIFEQNQYNPEQITVIPDQLQEGRFVLVDGYAELMAAKSLGLESLEVTIDAPNDRLPLFHTIFNVSNVLLLVWFLPLFERLVYRFIPRSTEEAEDTSLQYIGGGIMETPELSIEEARKEAARMGKLVQKMQSNVQALYFGKPKDKARLIEKLRRREEVTDEMELEIAHFLATVSEKDLSAAGSQRIQSLLSIINDLERIADICCRLALSEPKMREDVVQWSQEIGQPIERMFGSVFQGIKRAALDLESDFASVNISQAEQAEADINMQRNALNALIFQSLERGRITALESIAYLNLVSSMERIGDLVLNISRVMHESR
jgi:phosphate:Na+ symporter